MIVVQLYGERSLLFKQYQVKGFQVGWIIPRGGGIDNGSRRRLGSSHMLGVVSSARYYVQTPFRFGFRRWNVHPLTLFMLHMEFLANEHVEKMTQNTEALRMLFVCGSNAFRTKVFGWTSARFVWIYHINDFNISPPKSIGWAESFPAPFYHRCTNMENSK